MKLPQLLILIFFSLSVRSQHIENNPGVAHGNKFERLGPLLPTPNEYRTASGAPGPKYWQQRADYNIQCELDDIAHSITGKETITYFNNSPDILTYLWLQLDENIHSESNNANYQFGSVMPQKLTADDIIKWEHGNTNDSFGVKIKTLTDAAGKKLPYTINKTMMRIDLPAPLLPGKQFVLKIGWSYKIVDRMSVGGRGGYEYFKEDGNYLYTISQWYPRLCAYTDFKGWQNHQYANKEFALTFGNFKVQMTVPADQVVGATGECQNYQQTMSTEQFSRWQKARASKEPVDIITFNEAVKNESSRSREKKTWTFKADSVRDFAWTSSRKFVWDAMPTYINGKKIMCMSYYGKEAYPLYHTYSTRLIAHTLKVYSDRLFPYPYPVAQSVEAANGIEYPMICFNFGRTDKDGNYTDEVKNGMIGVVIHEIGHNFLPMIINIDEREWSWMDEGINSFFEYFAEQAWDSTFPSRRGPARTVVNYMKQPKDQLEPIMTNVDNILQFGPNAYTKPAVAMFILRKTIMGPENFDFAFKTFATRWAFKHPTPADLFRTMGDASAEDLDWFWRGWFFGTDPCDLSLDTVKYYKAAIDPDKYFYELTIDNKGGLVMPIIIEWTYTDGTKEIEKIPAQIWRYSENAVTRAYVKDKEVKSIRLDPENETADIDESNNVWTKFGEPGKIGDR